MSILKYWVLFCCFVFSNISYASSEETQETVVLQEAISVIAATIVYGKFVSVGILSSASQFEEHEQYAQRAIDSLWKELYSSFSNKDKHLILELGWNKVELDTQTLDLDSSYDQYYKELYSMYMQWFTSPTLSMHKEVVMMQSFLEVADDLKSKYYFIIQNDRIDKISLLEPWKNFIEKAQERYQKILDKPSLASDQITLVRSFERIKKIRQHLHLKRHFRRMIPLVEIPL